MSDLVRGELFPSLADKVLMHYGEMHCDYTNIKNGDVVYCDTHNINMFKHILFKLSDLTIITHNSDGFLTDTKPWRQDGVNVKEFEGCFKKWYGQNVYTNMPNVIPLPIGFENFRWGKKDEDYWLVANQNIEKTGEIYLNCKQSTNIEERSKCYNECSKIQTVTKDTSNLSHSDYLGKIKSHKFVISPPGNGLDCHRTWEGLMMKSVPVLKDIGRIRDLYQKLPVLFVNDWSELKDINTSISYNFKNQDYLTFDYWKRYMEEN
jgi:hypothetical protein